MSPIRFPHPRFATPEGIVALGGALSEENLLEAYSRGIFPWPIEGLPLTWFSPPWRAILEFDQLHIPRSLVRARKNSTLRFTIDRAFETVIRACSKVERAHEKGTWINPGIIRAYCGLHARGTAHSVEAWEGDTLVGGVYGVDAGGVFGGESMFHLQPNASKLALLFLVDHLRSRGAEWMDIQVMSPHMEALGAIEISRGLFLRKLADGQARALNLFG
jgi:leucyl/phenylalanyl-tRNA--protein transferase